MLEGHQEKNILLLHESSISAKVNPKIELRWTFVFMKISDFFIFKIVDFESQEGCFFLRGGVEGWMSLNVIGTGHKSI